MLKVQSNQVPDNSPIAEFQGDYRFLSNFYNAPIVYEGKTYPTSEHLYQALKTLNPEEQERVRRAPTAGAAKKLGKFITLRPDWELVKQDVMRAIVKVKFNQNPELAQQLLQTGNRPLQEGNWWGDRYYGVDLKSGEGQNILGKILEEVRGQLRPG